MTKIQCIRKELPDILRKNAKYATILPAVVVGVYGQDLYSRVGSIPLHWIKGFAIPSALACTLPTVAFSIGEASGKCRVVR